MGMREKLIKVLQSVYYLGGLEEILADKLIANDVVSVVRCKDCKHYNKDAFACNLLPWVDSSEHENWYADDFCSYGERKDNGKTSL